MKVHVGKAGSRGQSFVCLLHQVSPKINSKQNKVYNDARFAFCHDIAGFFKKYRLKVKLEQCHEEKHMWKSHFG